MPPQVSSGICQCIHIPAYRHDHHTRQVPGWTVTCHPSRTLTWTTPGNRIHTTSPAEYGGRRSTGLTLIAS
jgi:hypothetical protein